MADDLDWKGLNEVNHSILDSMRWYKIGSHGSSCLSGNGQENCEITKTTKSRSEKAQAAPQVAIVVIYIFWKV